MSKITSWGFTNVSLLANEVKPVILNLFSEYSKKELADGSTRYTNLSSPSDSMETITIKAKKLADVRINEAIQNPSKNKGGVQYSIQVEDILSTTETEDPAYRIDEPLAVTITVRHAASANVTPAHVEVAVARALGAMYYADGASRLPRFIRQSTSVERN